MSATYDKSSLGTHSLAALWFITLLRHGTDLNTEYLEAMPLTFLCSNPRIYVVFASKKAYMDHHPPEILQPPVIRLLRNLAFNTTTARKLFCLVIIPEIFTRSADPASPRQGKAADNVSLIKGFG